MKYKVLFSLSALAFVNFIALAQTQPITVKGNSTVGVIVAGKNNKIEVNQIFYSSPEYAEIKYHILRLDTLTEKKKTLLERAKKSKFDSYVVNALRDEVVELSRERDSVLKVKERYEKAAIALVESLALNNSKSNRTIIALDLIKKGKINKAYEVLKISEIEADERKLLVRKKINDSLLKDIAHEYMIKASLKSLDFKDKKRFDSIRYYFNKSLAVYEYGSNLYAYATFLLDVRSSDSAVIYLEKGINFGRLKNDSNLLLACLAQLAQVYISDNEYAKAEPLVLECIILNKKIEIDSNKRKQIVATNEMQLAAILANKNENASAINLYKKIYKDTHLLKSIRVDAITELMMMYSDTSKRKERHELVREGIKIFELFDPEKIPNEKFAAAFYSGVATAYLSQLTLNAEETEIAEQCLLAALSIRKHIAKKRGNPLAYLGELFALSIIYKALGEFKKSEEYLLEYDDIIDDWMKSSSNYGDEKAIVVRSLYNLYTKAIKTDGAASPINYAGKLFELTQKYPFLQDN